ncbi:methylated-DNA--[protein]-cysteine S-methyltransferase [Fimbriimonas ginsengisoli]|uniref:Methylated-DNA--protein-cysteine methyltransferase n=1 Tax=Fimbriimonas ginsengisoli Gsoil 348 TaxID=661478 RepID=A0A068NJA2_FIMGI|nr:methylated-DNA--[protein]-cysteine S-methyltransferase [Fimbriimonas ginsengisoli]AIE83551.1 methylated-DNA/protein-cysteinemethyltransferase [Fimbriimonas ginsengisoli Gsoil 348]
MATYYDTLSTPIGELLLIANEAGELTHLYTGQGSKWLSRHPGAERDPKRLAPAKTQLSEYFEGKRRTFDLPLGAAGSEFQHRVWEALMEIPFGETRSYGQLAAQLGVPNASRAVGRANATNPIGIIVPCHRVIGSNGTLTGYAGGLPTKEWLLRHEGVPVGKEQPAFEL